MQATPSFGYWLRRRRKALDLSQQDLARRVGCTPETIKKIESDERRPSQQLVALLASHLAIALPEGAHLRAERPPEGLPLVAEESDGLAQLRPHNIARLPTSFVGRGDDLAVLGQRLADAAVRLLTIIGAGGAGKTRLALELARRQLAGSRFPAGVFAVELASVTSLNSLVSAIGAALGLAFKGSQPPEQQLFDYLRHKELLLLLDGFEQLLAFDGLAIAILAHAPRVTLLITSREPLCLQEEYLHQLRGLPTPADDELADGSDAMQLFAERARLVDPAFDLHQHAPAVAAICRLVDGLPLGIELAAASVAALSCREIAREIARSREFRPAQLWGMPGGNEGVRAAFDHSWRLLAQHEQASLRRLAAFVGGFRPEAAAEVAGASPQTLAALAEKSLVHPDGAGRFRLHGLVRQFAAELLRDDPTASRAVRERHSAHYLQVVQDLGARLADTGQAQALDEEATNIAAAWSTAAELGDIVALSGALEAIFSFYQRTYRYREGVEIFETTLQRFRAARPAGNQRLLDSLLVRIEAQVAVLRAAADGGAGA